MEELTKYEGQNAVMRNQYTMQDLVEQVRLVQEAMKGVMRKDEHYGIIPGCQKPSLLKPGAEKLSMLFRLAPEYNVQETEMPNSHRAYLVTCTMRHIITRQAWGQGVGSCSTMESKYRYRWEESISTGNPVPKEYWELNKKDREKAIELIGGKRFKVEKVDGNWEIVQKGEKSENKDIADTYNTVLKMAKKRAHIDATLTCTAASDIFTQDVEDLPEFNRIQDAVVVETKQTGKGSDNGHEQDKSQAKSQAKLQVEAQKKFLNNCSKAFDCFAKYDAIPEYDSIFSRLGFKSSGEVTDVEKQNFIIGKLNERIAEIAKERKAQQEADSAMAAQPENAELPL